MRIVELQTNTRTGNLTARKFNNEKSQTKAPTAYPTFATAQYNIFGAYPYQIINFKGYAEDKSFIDSAINLLDTTIEDVNSIIKNTYTEGYNNDFLDTVKAIEQDPNLYAKITETPEIFEAKLQPFIDAKVIEYIKQHHLYSLI